MALSAPSTPKPNFATPRKPANSVRTPLNSDNLEAASTPRKPHFATSQRTKLTTSTNNTPECFAKVTVETPNSSKKRNSSKEKFDRVSNLTVAVRIRPMNSRELACVGATDIVRVRNQELILRSSPTGNSAMSLDHIFQYDHIFWSCDENSSLYTSQEDVFLTVGKPLLNMAFRGYNACLFAYGQTGSGKSFSMMGRNNCKIVDIDSDYSGITPRFCRDLFSRISKLNLECSASVEVSYFEIYNEKIHDLLNNDATSTKRALKVREHPVWGPYIVDLSVHLVKSYKELRDWLILGNKNRATAATTMNEKSSRSHSIFSIELSLSDGLKEGDSSRRSKVSLIDLAGSERLTTLHNSDEQMRQGVSINKSLLTLGKVISALSGEQKKNQAFIPYRESVLTWLLRESLGGNSLTSMLATISPASTHLDETLATLRYACQARAIVNRARINENPHDRLIRELRSEVERLKALRQDYERSSISSISSFNDNSNNTEELDDLRLKLISAEKKLLDAEESWKRRFTETAEWQMKELAESEKRREELESKVRILKTADNEINLSPYKSNFLEELENILLQNQSSPTVLNENNNCDDLIDNIINYCQLNNLICTSNGSNFTIVDEINQKQALLKLDNVKQLRNYRDFINTLIWTSMDADKPRRKLSKSEIAMNMSQIYQALNNLKPSDAENNLSLLFAKVNKSLQSFETALLNNAKQKTVTFNL